MKWIKGQYERLYEQVKSFTRTACYVDYDFWRDPKMAKVRDICSINPNKPDLELSSRGHGYSSFIEPDENELKNFIEECERLNVEWLDESLPASLEDEAKALYPDFDESTDYASDDYRLNEVRKFQRSAHITCAGMYTDTIDKLKAENARLKQQLQDIKEEHDFKNKPLM